jgi:hypothetical protein
LCHFQQREHCTIMDFRASSRAEVMVPKRRSWWGTAEVSVPSVKFTNQLLEARLGLELL